MAANKYLALVAGKLKEVFASNTGTPNAIGAMDATGRFDISMMPLGVSQEVVVCASKESLIAGDFVNLVLDGGVIKVQKADATTNAKPAHGFVIAIVTHPDPAVTVYLLGVKNSYVSGKVIGTTYFLDKTVPGGVIDTSPSATGNIVQELGKATLTTEILTFNNINYIEIG